MPGYVRYRARASKYTTRAHALIPASSRSPRRGAPFPRSPKSDEIAHAAHGAECTRTISSHRKLKHESWRGKGRSSDNPPHHSASSLSFCLERHGLVDHVRAFNLVGATIARETAGHSVYVAGSIGPTGLVPGVSGDWDDDRVEALGLRRGGPPPYAAIPICC
jgi:hypothetical protein